MSSEVIDTIMEQAQIFASAYSLVGGRFDDGSRLMQSGEEKAELRRMIEEALAPTCQSHVETDRERDIADIQMLAGMVGATFIPNAQPSPSTQMTGYPIEDEDLRYWRVWWHGSGPKRGDHIMLASRFDLGYEREIAYLGDQHHDEASALVHLHNIAVDKLRKALSVITEGQP